MLWGEGCGQGMPSRKNPFKGRQFTAEVILWANGIENIARELYVNALNPLFGLRLQPAVADGIDLHHA
jgi:hypothetical protein